jgi:hypothetical protein
MVSLVDVVAFVAVVVMVISVGWEILLQRLRLLVVVFVVPLQRRLELMMLVKLSTSMSLDIESSA